MNAETTEQDMTAPPESYRILVVDDEAPVRNYLSEVLRTEGYQVEVAEDGRQALNMLESGDYHIAVSDLSMPHVDGVELIRRSREMDPLLQVVVVSGGGKVETVVTAMQEGAADYLLKGHGLDHALLISVERAIERRELTRRNDMLVAEIQRRNEELEAKNAENARLLSELEDFNARLTERVYEATEELRQKHDALTEHAETMRALQAVGTALTGERELRPLLSLIMDQAKQVMKAEASSLMLLDAEAGELVFEVAQGERGEALREIRLPLGQGIAGWVGEKGQSLLIPDAYQDERFNPEVDRKSGFRTRSVLCVPLLREDRVTGVVQVINPVHGGAFTEQDLAVFEMFASQAAVAIENAQLCGDLESMADDLRRALEEQQKTNRELQSRLQEIQALRDVGHAINSLMDVGRLLELIMEHAKSVMDAEASSLMLLDEETQELVFQVAQGEAGEAVRQFRIKVGQGIAGWVAQTGEPLLIPDAYEDPRFNPDFDKKSGFRTKSILCAPLLTAGEVRGVVQVINRRDGSSFEDRDLKRFISFATQAAVALDNARLYSEVKQMADDLREALEKQRWLTIQKDKMGKFLPRTVVEDVEKNREEALRVSSKNVEATIVFTDIVGFTRKAENTPPETIVALLNNYQTRMVEIIEKYHGVLDKFMGDGIMAIFLPDVDSLHARRAVQAGIEMQRAVRQIAGEWVDAGLGDLQIRVGVNTGQVVAGTMGAETRMDYTVIGDNVNVASRIESNGFPGQVLLSESTYQSLQTHIPCVAMEPLRVKNRAQPVPIYSVAEFVPDE